MKYVITADDFYGSNGQHIPAGTEFSTESALPADWLGKVRTVDAVPEGAVPITNEAPTREAIAAMDKAEVLEWLEAHGWDGDKRLGVEKLRDALTAIMFVGE